jgi:putative peptide zinc metalloprotease protein
VNSSVSDLVRQALLQHAAAGSASSARQAAPAAVWPQLRQELALHPGASMRDGQPSWNLHDPVRNLYFQLDWLSFEVLSHWHLEDAQAIAEAIAQQTTLQPSPAAVNSVGRFLKQNQLVHVPGADNSSELAATLARSRMHWWKSLLHHYLFFRIPLVRPDAMLAWLAPRMGLFFDRRFMQLTLLAFVGGVALVYREWDAFSTTLVDNFSWSGAFAWVLVLVLVKVLHELGHGVVARRYGCRVPAMGVAFLVLFPMPYTDTNEAWKLSSRRQRLLIGSAGVLTELIIAVWATLAWAFLPDGLLRHMAFLLSTTTWISTLVVNCSPFMRFDGYFVLADFLEMPNLHARAFALGRWKLREWLFGLGAAPPEHVRPTLRRGLLAFAYLTWIYRLVVFLGIAALVYTFFIKAVGLLLFAVEIIWFVIMPIRSEIKVWSELWPRIRKQGRTRLTAALTLVLLALCFLPLPGMVRSTGLLHPGEEFPVHAREATRLHALHVRDGAAVVPGTPLLKLDSELIERRMQAADGRLARFDAELSASAFNMEQRHRLQVREGEFQTANSARRALESQKQESEPVAKVSGQFRLTDPDLKPGAWLSRNEQIGTVISGNAWYVECYVSEEVVHRLAAGDRARFYLHGKSGTVLPLRVAAIDRDATHVLDKPILSAQYGGSLETREVEARLFPEKAAYRVKLDVQENDALLAGQSWRGNVAISAAPESVAARFGRAALSLLWREAGL